jgi:GxxExxY protein
MPIEVMTPIRPLEQEAFHALDRRVMRIVFDVHNEFGRLLDEELYKSEIAARCVAEGIAPAEREVRVRVIHESFAKDYSIDLLLCSGFMLEAKVADGLVSPHRGQAVNYLLLAGLKHGRLINFRTERVQHEFVSTTVTWEERRRMQAADAQWEPLSDADRKLKTTTMALLADWGGFLDVNLYREALVHFSGGAAGVCKPVEIFSGSRRIGTQSLNLLNEQTAFAVTSMTRGREVMHKHLQRLLDHTRLRAIQWINLDHHTVEFVTGNRREDRIM